MTEKTSTAEPAVGRGLTPRAMLLALLVQVGVIVWVVRSEVTARTWVSNWALPMPAVLVLLLLVLVNGMRRRPWGAAELLLVYLTITTTVVLVGYNFIQLLIPMMATPFYHATAENHWSRMHPFLPTWLTVRDPEVIRGLFAGNAAVPWRAWLVPLAAWGLLIFALCVATLSLNVLLARHWIHHERITFPVATLPVELTSPRAPLMRNRVMWLGFALATVAQSACAFNYYWPWVPHVPLRALMIHESFTGPPWTVLGDIRLQFTPFQFGLAFLAPTDVSFSVWCFFWLGKVQRLIAYSLGYMDPNNISDRGAPYLQEQTIGAFLAMGLFLLSRVTRGMRRESVTSARNTPGVGGDTRPSGAAVTFVVAVAVMIGFLVAAGMALWLAAGMVFIHFLMIVTITRVRAEAGFPWVYGPLRWAGGTASHIMANSVGTVSFPPSQLVALGLFHWFWWDVRFTQMPGQFEALKIGDAAGMRQRQLVAWIVLATAVAIAVGMIAALRDSYQFGWGTAKTYRGVAEGAKTGFILINEWWDNPMPMDATRTAGSIAGGIVTLLLIAARQQFVWWPLHPVGYIMGATHTATMMWSYYFTSWALKSLVLRYGGMRLYRTVVPFFVGLILGDLATMATWSLVASILSMPIYAFV